MPDMQQLERAFLKAHQAGDKKAAGVLAAEIKRQRATATTQTEQPDGEASGLWSQFKAGIDAPLENMGTSMVAAGEGLGQDWMKRGGETLKWLTDKPEGHVSASEKFINSEGEGYNWSDLPGAAVEQGGQVLGSLGARAVGAGVMAPLGPGAMAAGAFGGPAVFEFAQQIGPLAIQRAKNNGRTEPNWEDWSVAAAAAGASGALNAIGIGGVGKLNSVFGIGKNIVKEAGTETLQSTIEQGAEKLGTETGGPIDLKQAVGEGIIGGTSVGGVDAARNAKPAYDATMDARYVRKQLRDNPFAAEDAELTQYMNQLDSRDTQTRDLQTREVNRYRTYMEDQVIKSMKDIGLNSKEMDAVKTAIKKAEGLSDPALDEEVAKVPGGEGLKPLAQKAQRLRQLTVQQQTAKGLRGFAASGISLVGPFAGGYIGAQMGGPVGAAAGAEIGRRWTGDIARKLRGSQTQGANIEKLVGTKAARRAEKILARTGPSKATQALELYKQQAEAKVLERQQKAQAEADAKATLAAVQAWQRNRAAFERKIEKAKTDEEKARLRAEKQAYDAAYRDTRLKMLQMQTAVKEAQANKIIQDMEGRKALQALKEEAARTQTELTQRKAQAKATSLDKQADFETKNLEGKLQSLALQIQRREVLLERAKNAGKRSKKIKEAASSDTATENVVKFPDVVTRARAKAKAEEATANDIKDPGAYQRKIDEANAHKQVARDIAHEDGTDEALGDLILDTIDKIDRARDANGKPDRKQRIEIFEDALEAASSIQSNGRKLMRNALEGLAYMTFSSVTPTSPKAKPKEQDIPF